MPVYVQHEVLGKVDDVFDPDALWQAPGLALFSRRPLLRDLLERSPRELRGRSATRCFSHVTLMLPQEDVDDDRHLTRGARTRDLAQGLAALHQKDFGDLLSGDEVRYHVVGAERLAPGEVEVKFGHAVYLPAPNEKVQYTVAVSRDSAVWKTVCAIYPNQRLTLIGNDEHGATWAAPGWPFGAEGAVLLINDGPGAPLELQVRPKDMFDCSYDAAAGYYTIRSRRGAVDGAGLPLRLLLRVTPAAPAQAGARPIAAAPVPASVPAPIAASMPVPTGAPTPAHLGASARASAAPGAAMPSPGPAVWKPRAAAQPPAQSSAATPIATRAGIDMTALPLPPAPVRPAPVRAPAFAQAELDATFAPVARQRVALAALALPRLSRYRETGARALQIGLDRSLAPTAPGRGALLSVSVDDEDRLHAITAAGRERIAAPASFNPLDGTTVELLAAAPELADRYCALLRLPQAPNLPVAPGARFAFGRGAPMLAGLRVLDSPAFLSNGDGVSATSADRLGLSRNAFSFEALEDGYGIARLSATQALYHLDPDLAFVAEVKAATPEQPYRLPAGHHLVAGHYVLRFEA
ncbi:hypothetical protein [Massilia sp. 9096]|uniref:hypothetical protein n=1 Tax=Massilia sp. 9096 TaxID=1500894 RepID=UPI00056C69C9|nr:hypothetical protein [Massilia sp. 9096]